jgi:hypothetical protein
MARRLLHLGITSVGALTLMMGAILVFPYDDGGLGDLFAKADCVKLCFLDIRPGITTLGEALEKLGSSDWVTDMEIDAKAQLVSWQWTGQQPRALDADRRAVLEYNDNRVLRIHLFAHIPLAEVMLRWANSRLRVRFGTIGFRVSSQPITSIYYLGNGYVAATRLNCHNFWDSPTSIIVGATIRYYGNLSRPRLDLMRLKQIIRTQCL